MTHSDVHLDSRAWLVTAGPVCSHCDIHQTGGQLEASKPFTDLRPLLPGGGACCSAREHLVSNQWLIFHYVKYECECHMLETSNATLPSVLDRFPFLRHHVG